jgi:sec-independent protein translocase protein TatA
LLERHRGAPLIWRSAMRLGFGEIAIILVIALLFFGPSKLPQLGKSLGDAIRGFKKGINSSDDEPANQDKLPPAA